MIAVLCCHISLSIQSHLHTGTQFLTHSVRKLCALWREVGRFSKETPYNSVPLPRQDR